jgi:hypothetical protein
LMPRYLTSARTRRGACALIQYIFMSGVLIPLAGF